MNATKAVLTVSFSFPLLLLRTLYVLHYVPSSFFFVFISEQQPPFKLVSNQQPYSDPAIMSARLSALPEPGYGHMEQLQMSYGPPGLSYPQNALQQHNSALPQTQGVTDGMSPPVHGKSCSFSSERREVSIPSRRTFSVRKFYHRH